MRGGRAVGPPHDPTARGGEWGAGEGYARLAFEGFFCNFPRELNQAADYLVNKSVDFECSFVLISSDICENKLCNLFALLLSIFHSVAIHGKIHIQMIDDFLG